MLHTDDIIKHISHAYIFEGQKGLGKLAAAKRLAMTCVCESSAPPCMQCENCKLAARDIHADIKTLSISDITDKKSIGAEDIRGIIADAYIKPFKAARKVYIIKDGDRLTPQAQNAMLKICEEPPDYVVFIIITSNMGAILQTIRSRGTHIRFSPLNNSEMHKYISDNHPQLADKADFIAALCGGIPQKVDDMAGNGFLELRNIALNIFLQLISNDTLAMYKAAEELEKYKADIESIFDLMLLFSRDALLIKLDADTKIINSDLADRLNTDTQPNAILRASEAILRAKKMISSYVNIKAIVYNIFLGCISPDTQEEFDGKNNRSEI